MITNFFLIEAEQVTAGDKFDTTTSKNIINEIIEKVKKNNYIIPSQEWLSGVLVNGRFPYKSDREAVRKLYRFDSLKSDEERATFRENAHFSEAQEKTARNIKAVFDTLAKYKLVTPVLDAKKRVSDYRFPINNTPGHSDGQKREKISKLRDKIRPILMEHYRSLLKKTADDLTEQEYEAGAHYIENLPEDLQKAFSVFVELDRKDFAYMKHVIKVRDEAAAKKDSYTKDLQYKFDDSASAATLAGLGVITRDGKVNLPLVRNIMKLLTDKNFVFSTRDFAIDYYQTLKKLSSDRTYSENALAKRMSGTEDSIKANRFVDSMSPQERSDLLQLYTNANSNSVVKVNPNSMEKFKSAGLLDQSNKFTDMGAAVAAILRAGGNSEGGGSLGNINKAVDTVTSRPVDKTMSNSPPIRDDKTYDTIQDRKQMRNKNIVDLANKGVPSDREDSTVAPTTRSTKDGFLKYRQEQLKKRSQNI